MARMFSTVWVIGLGTVGSRLAVLLAEHGYRVIGVEQDTASLNRARERVRGLTGRAPELSDVDRSSSEAEPGWIDYMCKQEFARPADLVIEAVPDRMAVKTEVLRRAIELCGPQTVFVTTTTGLSVAEIAASCGRLTRTVGMQLGAPTGAPWSAMVEVTRLPVTDRSVVEAVRMFARSLGKEPVTGEDHPGTTGNALVLRYLNRAAEIFEEGYASRDDIDTAMTLGCGLPLGPLAHLDMIGLDAAADSLTALAERTGDPAWAPAPIIAEMAEAGLLGRKTGRGFYPYDTPEGVGSSASPADQEVSVSSRPVHGVGVVGAGTMAVGIAETFAAAGFPTTLVARTNHRAKEARSTIEAAVDRRVRKGRMTSDDRNAMMERLTFGSELSALTECGLVIEAVVEDLAVKREVLAGLDLLVRPGAILATTTSSLPVIKCATATSRPQDVIGLHFLNPAPVMPLVEVVHTFLTAPDVMAAARSLVTKLGKQAVCCADRTGFIVNALLLPYLNDAVAMARTRHLAIADIDRVMTEHHGYPMGPFRLLDLIGIDVSVSILESIHEAFPEADCVPAAYLTDLLKAGWLGRKSGRGFYHHDSA